MTVAEAIDVLRAAGVASAEHDARALARHAEQTDGDFAALVRRRAAREPLQHLVGSTGFRYRDLEVGPGVFVPRPESEVVAGAALDELRSLESRGRVEAPVVVDLCAGSGTLGYAIADEHPSAVVHLVEMDPGAFSWLRRNRPATDRVHLVAADAGDPATLAELDGTVDVVVSNPPYVAVDEAALVDPEVLDHDPAVALFAGADGLDVIRRVAPRALALLRPGGAFVVEHSDRQGESAPALLRQVGFVDVADHPDLTGRPRYTVARREAR